MNTLKTIFSFSLKEVSAAIAGAFAILFTLEVLSPLSMKILVYKAPINLFVGGGLVAMALLQVNRYYRGKPVMDTPDARLLRLMRAAVISCSIAYALLWLRIVNPRVDSWLTFAYLGLPIASLFNLVLINTISTSRKVFTNNERTRRWMFIYASTLSFLLVQLGLLSIVYFDTGGKQLISAGEILSLEFLAGTAFGIPFIMFILHLFSVDPFGKFLED